MLYRVIGLMSGSSLDGLDIAYVHLLETRGKWSFEIQQVDCLPYSTNWRERLEGATDLNARDYLYLHSDYGRLTGGLINKFIADHQLSHQVHLIASHGHTTFHDPAKGFTAQLGDGATIAAASGLPVVSDLRAIDVAFSGQGAPIVPIGEKLLFEEHNMFLNLGGIANLSVHKRNKNIEQSVTAFDVCPCNRILNRLAERQGLTYDEDGKIAQSGVIDHELLERLNKLEYYKLSPPKSLSNDFGANVIYPMLMNKSISNEDCMRTYGEHIIDQIVLSVKNNLDSSEINSMLVTGGGAFNSFLMNTLKHAMQNLDVSVVVPDSDIIQYKEAIIMALIGILRWREESNVLSSVTGASKDSIGGALWLGGQL